MRCALFVLLVLVGPAAFAQSSPRQVLDACIDSLDATVVGLEAMEAACPGLSASLERLGIAALLPQNQPGLLTRDGLINLRSLHARYEQRPERSEIDDNGLQPVLESLREPAEAERSLPWYERFKRWLREALDRQEEQAHPWLRRWLDEHPMSDTVQRVLIYAVMLLAMFLAIVIIVNEIRTERAGRRKASPSGTDSGVAGASSPASMADDLRGKRASALLRMLVATLVNTGRLHGAHSLTHRELISRAKFDDATHSDSFRRVARLAEQEIFGGKHASGAELDDVVQAGRRLHAQLTGAAT